MILLVEFGVIVLSNCANYSSMIEIEEAIFVYSDTFGFDIKEPKRVPPDKFDYHYTGKLDENYFSKLWELHQLSKQFKYIDNTTKVMFVRNRIPRTLIKSKINPGAALITLGGGYFSVGTENLKRLLENLPKKLYYSDSQPSSFDWHDHIIIKL